NFTVFCEGVVNVLCEQLQSLDPSDVVKVNAKIQELQKLPYSRKNKKLISVLKHGGVLNDDGTVTAQVTAPAPKPVTVNIHRSKVSKISKKTSCCNDEKPNSSCCNDEKSNSGCCNDEKSSSSCCKDDGNVDPVTGEEAEDVINNQ